MTGNNPKLGLVNVDVHTKFGQILSIRSQDNEQKRIVHGMTERRNDGITEGQGESSIAPLFQSGAIKISVYCIGIYSKLLTSGSCSRLVNMKSNRAPGSFTCNEICHIMRKLDFRICENKGADQLCSDQRLCLR